MPEVGAAPDAESTRVDTAGPPAEVAGSDFPGPAQPDAAEPAAGRREEPAEPDAAASARSVDGLLARLHLRTGLLSLARAELETMAGRSALDREALVDLAEVRWRTGDLVGAGEAAAAYLEVGGDEAVAYCVAAEAAMATGRSVDAEGYARHVLERTGIDLDDLFAGQPRSALWPPPAVPPAPSATGGPARPPVPASRNVTAPPTRETMVAGPPATDVVSEPDADASSRGSGRHAAETADAGPLTTPGADLQAAGEELARLERRIAAGELAGAAARLALVLRLEPVLAPAVLALSETLLARDALPVSERPAILLVRSDAYRSTGREGMSRDALQEARRLLDATTESEENA